MGKLRVTFVVLAVASVVVSLGAVGRRALQERHDHRRCDVAGGYWAAKGKICRYPPTQLCPVFRVDAGRVGITAAGGWCEVPLDELPELIE